MKITEKPRLHSIRKNRRAASPAVSMVIITAATIVLVLVSSNYAMQVLERQQAASEFDTVKKSLIAFDDSVRDIAWDRGASRSVRFTTRYGTLALVPDSETLTISVPEHGISQSLSVGTVKYAIPSELVTFGEGYENYVLGNDAVLVSSTTDSFGRILAEQQAGSLSLSLDYRVRVTHEGPAMSINSKLVTYVDILLIKMVVLSPQYLNADYDLVARNIGVSTQQFGPFDISSPTSNTITVKIGDVSNSVQIGLSPNSVVFNLIISEVRVST